MIYVHVLLLLNYVVISFKERIFALALVFA